MSISRDVKDTKPTTSETKVEFKEEKKASIETSLFSFLKSSKGELLPVSYLQNELSKLTSSELQSILKRIAQFILEDSPRVNYYRAENIIKALIELKVNPVATLEHILERVSQYPDLAFKLDFMFRDLINALATPEASNFDLHRKLILLIIKTSNKTYFQTYYNKHGLAFQKLEIEKAKLNTSSTLLPANLCHEMMRATSFSEGDVRVAMMKIWMSSFMTDGSYTQFLNALDSHGRTPLDYASIWANRKHVDALTVLGMSACDDLTCLFRFQMGKLARTFGIRPDECQYNFPDRTKDVYEALKAPRDAKEDKEVIENNSGNFGAGIRVQLRDKQQLMVKRLYSTSAPVTNAALRIAALGNLIGDEAVIPVVALDSDEQSHLLLTTPLQTASLSSYAKKIDERNKKENNNPLEEKDLIQHFHIGSQLFSPLAIVHRKLAIHGDIHPQHILISEKNGATFIKLSGLDLSPSLHDTPSHIRLELWNPWTAQQNAWPPELVPSSTSNHVNHYTQLSDVYSMGQVLQWLNAKNQKLIAKFPAYEKVFKSWDIIINLCCAAEPKDRLTAEQANLFMTRLRLEVIAKEDSKLSPIFQKLDAYLKHKLFNKLPSHSDLGKILLETEEKNNTSKEIKDQKDASNSVQQFNQDLAKMSESERAKLISGFLEELKRAESTSSYANALIQEMIRFIQEDNHALLATLNVDLVKKEFEAFKAAIPSSSSLQVTHRNVSTPVSGFYPYYADQPLHLMAKSQMSDFKDSKSSLALKNLLEQKDKPVFAMIDGPGTSGKTTAIINTFRKLEGKEGMKDVCYLTEPYHSHLEVLKAIKQENIGYVVIRCPNKEILKTYLAHAHEFAKTKGVVLIFISNNFGSAGFKEATVNYSDGYYLESRALDQEHGPEFFREIDGKNASVLSSVLGYSPFLLKLAATYSQHCKQTSDSFLESLQLQMKASNSRDYATSCVDFLVQRVPLLDKSQNATDLLSGCATVHITGGKVALQDLRDYMSRLRRTDDKEFWSALQLLRSLDFIRISPETGDLKELLAANAVCEIKSILAPHAVQDMIIRKDASRIAKVVLSVLDDRLTDFVRNRKELTPAFISSVFGFLDQAVSPSIVGYKEFCMRFILSLMGITASSNEEPQKLIEKNIAQFEQVNPIHAHWIKSSGKGYINSSAPVGSSMATILASIPQSLPNRLKLADYNFPIWQTAARFNGQYTQMTLSSNSSERERIQTITVPVATTSITAQTIDPNLDKYLRNLQSHYAPLPVRKEQWAVFDKMIREYLSGFYVVTSSSSERAAEAGRRQSEFETEFKQSKQHTAFHLTTHAHCHLIRILARLANFFTAHFRSHPDFEKGILQLLDFADAFGPSGNKLFDAFTKHEYGEREIIFCFRRYDGELHTNNYRQHPPGSDVHTGLFSFTVRGVLLTREEMEMAMDDPELKKSAQQVLSRSEQKETKLETTSISAATSADSTRFNSDAHQPTTVMQLSAASPNLVAEGKETLRQQTDSKNEVVSVGSASASTLFSHSATSGTSLSTTVASTSASQSQAAVSATNGTLFSGQTGASQSASTTVSQSESNTDSGDDDWELIDSQTAGSQNQIRRRHRSNQ